MPLNPLRIEVPSAKMVEIYRFLSGPSKVKISFAYGGMVNAALMEYVKTRYPDWSQRQIAFEVVRLGESPEMDVLNCKGDTLSLRDVLLWLHDFYGKEDALKKS
jgi:hypothetical protein